MGETSAAKARRERAGFFEKYCGGRGVDVGAYDDPLFPTIDIVDWHSGGDALKLPYSDGEIDFVYSSHCLEDISFALDALQEWRRAIRVGGRLILYLPDRDTCERKKELPSNANGAHKHYWTLFNTEPPCTFGLVPLLLSMSCWNVVYAQLCDQGEYSIEVVAVKLY